MATEQPMITNPAKDKLKRGEAVIGLAVFESLRPSIYKIVAQAGYDIVLVDTEHVMHNLDTLTDFLVGARDNGGSGGSATGLPPDRPSVRPHFSEIVHAISQGGALRASCPAYYSIDTRQTLGLDTTVASIGFPFEILS